MTDDIIDFGKYRPYLPPIKSKKKKKQKVRHVIKDIESLNPDAMFAMTWSKRGIDVYKSSNISKDDALIELHRFLVNSLMCEWQDDE